MSNLHKHYIQDEGEDASYSKFIRENGILINKILNRILWCMSVSGPAVALMVWLGVFQSMTYFACLNVTVLCLIIAGVHTIYIKKFPTHSAAKYIILIGIEIILVYMRIENFEIVFMMFIPPLLSLLFCEKTLYYIISAVSYVGLIAGLFLSADHWSSFIPTETSMEWFRDHAIGYTLEYALVIVVGLMISILITWHMGTTFSDKMLILDKEQEAYTDRMTGLWNKMYLQKAFVRYVVQRRYLCSLIIVDLDNFKYVNDTYGHAEGDRALVSFAGVFEQTMSSIEKAVLCRFGGDEFVAFLPNFDDEEALETTLRNLKKKLSAAFEEDEHLKGVTMSIGATVMKSAYEEYKDIFERADNSVLYVKNHGKDNYHIYQEGDSKEAAPVGR